MKNILSVIIVSITLLSSAFAQVPQKILVEHFTNTLCGNCANRNPGLFSNIESQSDVLHIAYHPSSPYSACELNKHNTSENDNRTKHYGIFGSTPKITINGNGHSGSFNNASMFSPYLGQMSSVSLTFTEAVIENNNVKIKLDIKAEENNSIGNVKIQLALAEEEVKYDAPNGEKLHHNVFRKSMTAIEGDDVTIPAIKDEITTISLSTAVNSEWDLDELFPLAVLQNTDNTLIQAEKGGLSVTLDSNDLIGESSELKVYPTIAQSYLFSNLSIEFAELEIFGVNGRIITKQSGTNMFPLDISNLDKGIYILNLKVNGNSKTVRFVKS